MLLRTLAGQRLRNFDFFRIEPNPRFNVFSGQNAQGKTNLLEAVAMLSSLKSFRTSRQHEVIQEGAQDATILAQLERRGTTQELKLQIKPRNRRVWLDGEPMRRLSDAMGRLQTVLFTPEDVRLLKGSPAERRAFIDRAVFNARASYLDDLESYNKVLKQRNALLREERIDPSLLEVFDQQLVSLGSALIKARLSYLDLLQPHFEQAFASIFGAGYDPLLSYESSWSEESNACMTEAEIASRLGKKLRRSRQLEQRRGSSLYGPHRDDIGLSLAGRSAKAFASQGQHRALVLALKIGEITLLKERFDSHPVLLLDDVSSELDAERNEKLFLFLKEFLGQVFITTTQAELLDLSLPHTLWRIEAGQITEVDR